MPEPPIIDSSAEDRREAQRERTWGRQITLAQFALSLVLALVAGMGGVWWMSALNSTTVQNGKTISGIQSDFAGLKQKVDDLKSNQQSDNAAIKLQLQGISDDLKYIGQRRN